VAGLFVTFEGGEGSGKSTQIARLAARVRAAGHEPVVTREPGGTPLAERIRELLLDPAHVPAPWTEAFLMEAARAELAARVVHEALDRGQVVLCDRHADSTLAYQGAGRGLDLEALARMNALATGGRRPDLTLLYDLDPSVGLARRAEIGAPLDRLDGESLAFHGRVRERFLALAAAEPQRFVVLDATQPADTLERLGWQAIESRWTARSAAPR
jgi:dTMP kinase